MGSKADFHNHSTASDGRKTPTELIDLAAANGVRIMALYPGAVDTGIWEGVPGEWDRTGMVPPREVARAVAFALDGDPKAVVEEVHVGPAGGAL